jgi:hypothetical protein
MRRPVAALSAASLVLVLVELACARAPRPAEPRPSPPVETSPPPLPPQPAASTTSATPPDATPPPSTGRRPRVQSSPNAIECHDVACDLATQICCTDGHTFGRCIARGDPAGCGSLDVLHKECDELGDCERGHVCCYAPRPDPSVRAMNVCRESDCEDPDYETCLAGGACSRGRRCKLASEDAYDGYCH